MASTSLRDNRWLTPSACYLDFSPLLAMYITVCWHDTPDAHLHGLSACGGAEQWNFSSILQIDITEFVCMTHRTRSICRTVLFRSAVTIDII